MNCATIFPREYFVPQVIAQIPHGFGGPLRSDRASPLTLKTRDFHRP